MSKKANDNMRKDNFKPGGGYECTVCGATYGIVN